MYQMPPSGSLWGVWSLSIHLPLPPIIPWVTNKLLQLLIALLSLLANCWLSNNVTRELHELPNPLAKRISYSNKSCAITKTTDGFSSAEKRGVLQALVQKNWPWLWHMARNGPCLWSWRRKIPSNNNGCIGYYCPLMHKRDEQLYNKENFNKF